MLALGGGVFRLGGRVVSLGPYFMDRTEVTAGAWQACVSAGACEGLSDPWRQRPEPRAAVTGVTWVQAARYCGWRSARLPTEAEWEYAARGTDGRRYPWGQAQPDCARARVAGCGDGRPMAGEHPTGTAFSGALDMAGNVAEWVADRSGLLPSTGYARDPTGPTEGSARVVRGGSFVSTPGAVETTARTSVDPREARFDVGFRCARGL